MTPTTALKLLAKASALIQTEQLAVMTVFVTGDHPSIDLTPADFAGFVRRHRLARRMYSLSLGNKSTYCSVHFRGVCVTTTVATPSQLPGLSVEFPALEATTALVRP